MNVILPALCLRAIVVVAFLPLSNSLLLLSAPRWYNPLMPNTIALFVTCLVDQVMPEVGVAVVKVLRRRGFDVVFPPGQTCCGQPFSNSGFTHEARRLAQLTIEVLEPYEIVVLPSGSCTTMLRKEYPHLFANDPKWSERASALAAKTFEFSEFLAHQGGENISKPSLSVTYHDSCHMCRSLGLKNEPRAVLAQAGCEVHELAEEEHCCGFGGLFSLRMPEIAAAMSAEKLDQAQATKTGLLVTADPGCLMHLRREHPGDSPLVIKHIAEIIEERTR